MKTKGSPKHEDASPESSGSDPKPRTTPDGYDLRFVWLEQNRVGGWYRELPDASLEVMSHAHLARVPLGDADPEQKARDVVADIVQQLKD